MELSGIRTRDDKELEVTNLTKKRVCIHKKACTIIFNKVFCTLIFLTYKTPNFVSFVQFRCKVRLCKLLIASCATLSRRATTTHEA